LFLLEKIKFEEIIKNYSYIIVYGSLYIIIYEQFFSYLFYQTVILQNKYIWTYFVIIYVYTYFYSVMPCLSERIS